MPAPFPPGSSPGPPAHVNNCTTNGDYVDRYQYGTGFKGPVEGIHSYFFYDDQQYNEAANAFGSRQLVTGGSVVLNQTGQPNQIVSQGFTAQFTRLEYVTWNANFSGAPNPGAGTIICELRTDAGGPPSGTVLASASIPVTSVVPSFGFGGACFFVFSPVTLSLGADYHLSLRVQASGTWQFGLVVHGTAFKPSTTDHTVDRTGTPPSTFAPRGWFGTGIGSMQRWLLSTSVVPAGWDRSIFASMIIGGEGLIVLGGLFSYCSTINGQGNAGTGDDTRLPQTIRDGFLPITGWGVGEGGFGPPEFGFFEKTPGNWHHYDGGASIPGKANGSTQAQPFDPDTVISGTPLTVVSTSHVGYSVNAVCRSDGTHVTLGQTASETIGGVGRRRCSWQINDHGNWGPINTFGVGAAVNLEAVDIVLDANDYAHMFLRDATSSIGRLYHVALAPDNTLGAMAGFDCVNNNFVQPCGTGHDDPNALTGGVVFPYVNSIGDYIAAYWPSDLTTTNARYEELPSKDSSGTALGICTSRGGPGCITFYGTRGYLFTNNGGFGGVYYAATFDPETGWSGNVRVHPPENPAGNSFLDLDLSINAMDGISANYLPTKGLVGVFYGYSTIYTSFGEMWFQYYSEPALGYPAWIPRGINPALDNCMGADWWSWGHNGAGFVGREGLPSSPDLTDAQKVALPYNLTFPNLATSQDAAAALTTGGQIFVWGSAAGGTGTIAQGKFGNQFPGITGSGQYLTVPPTMLTDTHASFAQQVVLTNGGTLWLVGGIGWGMGWNQNGEFGVAETIPAYHGTSVALFSPPGRAGIARLVPYVNGIGMYYIDGFNNLWYSGRLNGGMNGGNSIGPSGGNLTVPTAQIPLPSGVRDVAIAFRPTFGSVPGGPAVFALLQDGTVWWWGRSMIEPAPLIPTVNDPTLLAGVSGISQIYGTDGSGTVYFLTSSGNLLGLGSDTLGALGTGSWSGTPYASTYTPLDHYTLPLVPISFPGGRTVTKLAKGGSATFAMFAVTSDQQLWGLGLNDLMWGDSDPSAGGPGSGTPIVPPYPVFPDLFANVSTSVPPATVYPVIDAAIMAENVLFVRTGAPVIIVPPPVGIGAFASVLG